jgi:transposase
VIRHRPEAVRKLLAKLGPAAQLGVCYEAGPTGYPLYWQLTALGVHCDVIAPSLVPTKAGDRVKTDRKDAARLARCYRAGDLTAIWVPDAATEALRDLVRAREVAKQDQLRARHRVSKFLLRHGCQRPESLRAWTARHAQWLAGVSFDLPTLQVVFDDYRANLALLADRIARLERAIEAALPTLAPTQQALVGALATLRGVRTVTAATVVSDLGTMRRFARARQLMGYAGLVPREHSSGRSVHRGAITKTGNAHLRRVLVEAGWALSAPTESRQRRAAAAPAGPTAPRRRDRHPRTATLVRAVSPPDPVGQTAAGRRHYHRPRTPGLHLGHRPTRRTPSRGSPRGPVCLTS